MQGKVIQNQWRPHSTEKRCPDTGLVVFLVFNWSCRSFSWTGTVVGNATNACSDNVHVMHGSRIFFPRVWGARGIFLSANPLQIRACVYIMIYNNTVYHMHVPFFNILNKSYTCLEKGITTIHLCVQMTIAYQYDNKIGFLVLKVHFIQKVSLTNCQRIH